MVGPGVEGDPAPQPEGFEACPYLGGGVQQGEMVGVELRADGELAGGYEVEEGDPGEINEGRSVEVEEAVELSAQFTKGEEIELPPQLDQHARTGLPHFDAVQVFTSPLVGRRAHG